MTLKGMKAIGLLVAGLATGLYPTFVSQQLWNWFLVPTFNTSPISFPAMWGLLLLVNLLSDFSLEHVTKLLEALVPGETLLAHSKREAEDAWSTLGASCISNVVKYSVTLVIGWAVHTLLM